MLGKTCVVKRKVEMGKSIMLQVIALVIFVAGCSGPQTGVVSPTAEVRKLAGGFRFTEGPAADADGNVYFTDIPNNRIHIWSVEGELSTFMEDSGGANGLYFDESGNLLVCQGGDRQVVSIDAQGDVTVLADEYDGKKFNSPNDLWLDPKGGIYFTDPRYGSREDIQQDGEHVYYITPDRGNIVRVVDDMVRPNGLIGTPDGKTLYVTDNGAGKTWTYRMNADGLLADKKLFVEEGADGMTIDSRGNVYLTTELVQVYNPAGECIEGIVVPERPSNVCFGGKEQKTLFITARTSLYAIPMLVTAAQEPGGAED